MVEKKNYLFWNLEIVFFYGSKIFFCNSNNKGINVCSNVFVFVGD